jgi:hypothetical protein
MRLMAHVEHLPHSQLQCNGLVMIQEPGQRGLLLIDNTNGIFRSSIPNQLSSIVLPSRMYLAVPGNTLPAK